VEKKIIIPVAWVAPRSLEKMSDVMTYLTYGDLSIDIGKSFSATKPQ